MGNDIVVKPMPNRIATCRRIGAKDHERDTGGRRRRQYSVGIFLPPCVNGNKTHLRDRPAQARTALSMSSLSFDGSKVVVIGGSRGIGRATALGFAARGASVAVCARHPDSLHDVDVALASLCETRYVAACDVSDAQAVAAFVPAAAESLQGIDILVNCASALAPGGDEAAWSGSIAVDLMGTVRATQASVPFLKKSRHAAIVNVSSVAAVQATGQRPAYGAVKAAIVHYTASTAQSLAPFGIRVNCVVPGSTEFVGGIWDRFRVERPDYYEETRNRLPFGRFASPEEIAEVIFFLGARNAGWITGQSLVVDGGQTLTGS
jgi:3-oxoacyl-[acyl-carrier protein] reductase